LDPQTRQTSPRSAFSGICTLLAVGLLVGASLSAVQPGIRDLGRDTAVERAAVRNLTVTLARAVRDFVGDKTKPAKLPAARGPLSKPAPAWRIAPTVERLGSAPLSLRVELLDLPPPALRG
jgi:hypothetical protein